MRDKLWYLCAIQRWHQSRLQTPQGAGACRNGQRPLQEIHDCQAAVPPGQRTQRQFSRVASRQNLRLPVKVARQNRSVCPLHSRQRTYVSHTMTSVFLHRQLVETCGYRTASSHHPSLRVFETNILYRYVAVDRSICFVI